MKRRVIRALRPRAARLLSAAIALASLPALSALAAPVDCLAMQQPLVKIPEIVSSGGRLRGTILLNDQEERVNFRTPPQSLPGDLSQRTADTCFSQFMRAYHVGTTAAKTPSLADPLPGP